MRYVLDEFEDEIKRSVRDVLKLDKGMDLPIEVPDSERGEFALPCFVFASELGEAPDEIAESIADEIVLDYGKADQAGPYVNFRIDEDHLVEKTLHAALIDETFGSYESRDEKVIVEHTSANPNGPLHVGRARNPIIGDTMSRAYEKAGYDVERQYFVNDIGRQMAILSWGTMNLDEEELPDPDRDKEDHRLVRYYQRTSALLEEDEDLEDEIKEMIRAMERGQEGVYETFRENAEEVMDGIIRSLERMNIELDSFKNESDFIREGSIEDIIDDMKKLDGCGTEEGALYFEKRDNRTFLTRGDGTNLYPARDIAYHLWKAKRANRLLNILGEDHKLHGEFIRDAFESLDVEPIPEMLFYSFVSFEGEEMSTRKGTYVTLDDFMDTACEKAKDKISGKEELSDEEVEDISKMVGIGAVRFNIIKVQPEKHIDFRWEEALNLQGDSAPFVQYTHARASGILKRYEKDHDEDVDIDDEDIDIGDLDEEGEVRLVKKMAEFPWILVRTAGFNSPHQVANYALDLSREFNQFYRDYPVLQSEEKVKERIVLVKAYKNVISQVLDTLGIEAPEKM